MSVFVKFIDKTEMNAKTSIFVMQNFLHLLYIALCPFFLLCDRQCLPFRTLIEIFHLENDELTNFLKLETKYATMKLV